nr:PAAR domain-containing protein [Paraburkholderia rhizosphaerae]
MRHDICNGDTTTAGGLVIATCIHDLLLGRAVAYEGDLVCCRKCNSTGKIVCTGAGPRERGPDGRMSALSGDWCVCKCAEPPRLIALQDRSGARA